MERLSRTARIFLAAVTLGTAAGASAASATKRMSDVDFFLDRRDLVNQSVEVDSHFMAAGDLLLMTLPNATNATFIDVTKVERETRRAIYERCQGPCFGTVRGVVKVIPSALGPDVGIVAESFVLKP